MQRREKGLWLSRKWFPVEIRAIHDSKYDSGGRAHQPAVLDSQMFATQDGLLQNDYALRDHHDEGMDRAASAELGMSLTSL